MTLLLAVFELVLFMMVPSDLPVHYYSFCAIQKVHFIIIIIIIIRNLYSAIMPLGGYRGAGGTGR